MMNNVAQNANKTEELELRLYIRILEGPPSYETFVGDDSSSATQIDLAAATEADSRRFHEAWTELARS